MKGILSNWVRIIFTWFGLGTICCCNITLAQDFKAIDSSVFQNANNDQWLAFVKKFKSAENKVNILQIGDSHIQGGYFTNQVRKLMSINNIKVGTGITFPYNLAKTNGSEEIRYYSSNNWEVKKTMNKGFDKLSIAGYLISCPDSVIHLSIQLNGITDSCWTNRIRFYHNMPSCEAICDKTPNIEQSTIGDSVFFTDFILPSPTDSVSVTLIPHKTKPMDFQLLSVQMETYSSRADYHALGINGITFDGYLAKVDFLPWMKLINPDCLVVSFGTNDIYSGKIDKKAFARKVSGLIDTIRHAFPNMVIIITSPGDHLRYKKYNNYAIAPAVTVLHDVAYQKNCLFWDFFSEMGGEGSSRYWYKKGWMFRDYVHLSKEGYRQQGGMFYKIFMNTIEQTWQNEMLNAGIN